MSEVSLYCQGVLGTKHPDPSTRLGSDLPVEFLDRGRDLGMHQLGVFDPLPFRRFLPMSAHRSGHTLECVRV